jgi:hypothetical protein
MQPGIPPTGFSESAIQEPSPRIVNGADLPRGACRSAYPFACQRLYLKHLFSGYHSNVKS